MHANPNDAAVDVDDLDLTAVGVDVGQDIGDRRLRRCLLINSDRICLEQPGDRRVCRPGFCQDISPHRGGQVVQRPPVEHVDAVEQLEDLVPNRRLEVLDGTDEVLEAGQQLIEATQPGDTTLLRARCIAQEDTSRASDRA